MKYSILGFNQQSVVNYSIQDGDKVLKCDLVDLTLLGYIIYAQANPKMKHHTKDEISYVWLSHDHVLEDLPIIDMTDGTLRNRFSKLRKMNLIDSVTLANEHAKGTKSYYAITSLCYDMLFATTSFKNDMKEVPRNFKMTSDTSSSNLDKKVISTNSKELVENFQFGGVKQKKENLYTKCLASIKTFTQDTVLQDDLKTFLDLRLEISRDENKPFYFSMWTHLLSELKKLAYHDDVFDIKLAKEIVSRSTCRGWKHFYVITDNQYVRNSNEDRFAERNVVSESYTADELKELEELDNERRRNGQQTKF